MHFVRLNRAKFLSRANFTLLFDEAFALNFPKL